MPHPIKIGCIPAMLIIILCLYFFKFIANKKERFTYFPLLLILLITIMLNNPTKATNPIGVSVGTCAATGGGAVV
ncbi:MAG: hypothetical protein AEth_00236 [Candidatus Argoarchaeum ethanivorans]|uniref:Uncharacterized protein n=1 Tax=Candidatus Argoarchaeum ethanivorans TaxID=2608793 RepID=A0A8B3SAE8_9EURY|nr:MAG: hypothetical protein AEth_00236 [Candidatus Argoarchaeum ethanivorans]